MIVLFGIDFLVLTSTLSEQMDVGHDARVDVASRIDPGSCTAIH